METKEKRKYPHGRMIVVSIFLILVISIAAAGKINSIKSIDIIEPKLETECELYLNSTLVGGQRCCVIGWAYEGSNKYAIKKCRILQ